METMGRSFEGGGVGEPPGYEASFEDAHPKIEGFTKAEVEAIYGGRYEEALERFAGMTSKERTEQIIPLIGGLGEATYDLAEKIEAALGGKEVSQDARAYAEANTHLNAFLNKLLQVYEHGGPPSRDAN